MTEKELTGYDSPLAEILFLGPNRSIMVGSDITGPEGYEDGVVVDDIFE